MTSPEEEKEIAWKDLDLDSSLNAGTRKEEEKQGPPFRERIPLVPILTAVLIVVLVAGGIVLYAGLSRLKSDVTILRGKLEEVQAVNQKLKDEVTDLTKRLEMLKAERRERVEAEKKKVEPSPPKPAPAKKQPPAPAKAKKTKDR